ncbi:TetR/AcrR family transcriptional regulator [Mycobacterium vicinigordonae]
MEEVATAAGVGKGTLFRRFGDRAELIRAVVEHRSAALRDAVEHGPPPLGPDTAARERLAALLHALVDFKVRNRALSLAMESSRDGNPYGLNYQWMHQVFTHTLETLSPPMDSAWLAHTLLAAVRADLVEYLTETEGYSVTALNDQLSDLVNHLTQHPRA